MDQQTDKCVIVVDGALPPGIAANTAAIIGITIGAHASQITGPDVTDAGGSLHLGSSVLPIPILSGTSEIMCAILARLHESDYNEVHAADFTELARSSRTYEAFTAEMSNAAPESLRYIGIGLWGPSRKVTSLTGSLPLLR